MILAHEATQAGDQSEHWALVKLAKIPVNGLDDLIDEFVQLSCQKTIVVVLRGDRDKSFEHRDAHSHMDRLNIDRLWVQHHLDQCLLH